MNTFNRRDAREAIAEELLFHLEEKTRDNMARGMNPAAARESAMRSFGNRSLWTEAMQDAGVVIWLDHVRRDLFHAVRSLRKRSGLALTAIISLALGIGATTALFSVADAVFLRPLPFPHPEQLVAIQESNKNEPSNSNPVRMNDWSSQVPAFSAVGGYYSEGLVLTGQGDPVRLQTLRTFGRFLDVLGEKPLYGRLFAPDEQGVLLLTHGDATSLGKVLRLGGRDYTVIGILPALRFPEAVDAVAPAPPGVQKSSRKSGFLSIVARRKADASLQQVNLQLVTVAQRLAQQYPATDKERSAQAVSLQRDLGADARNPLLLIFGAAALVLLIACVNVAGLLLSRAIERQNESAIRISLGAGRGALVRHYLAESVVLSVAGGFVGLLTGKLMLIGLLHLMPIEFPALYDWRAALFALAVSLASGLFFGWAPMLQSVRLTATNRSTTSASGLWARRGLVAAQIALSALLLVAVGLVAKSLYRTETASPGFRPDSALTVQVNFGWDTPEAKLNDYSKRALESLAGIPGVMAVGMIDRLPLSGATQTGPIQVRGAEPKDHPVDQRAIAGDYFTAAGIPLLAGRNTLRAGETIVNQTLARRYFPDVDPVSRLISPNGKQYFTIVGVTGDVRVEATQIEQPAEMFIRAEETYWPLQNYVVRGMADPGAVRAALRRVDPNQLIGKIAPMGQTLSESSANQRARVWLLGSFAAMALLMAAIGLYGVLASDVAQRRVELGIRLTLGADPENILTGTVGQGVALAAAGLTIGLGGALFVSRLVASFLYGVAPTDPMVFGAVALVLIVTSAVASLLPAFRASRVDPAITLRES